MDPNTRIIEPEKKYTQDNVYKIVRNAVEEIRVDIDDADSIKGYVKGFYKNNKKQPFDVTFKKDTDSNKIGIKIDHKFSLREIERRDVRDLNQDKYEERLIVKFWDFIFDSFGLGQDPSFGEKSTASSELTSGFAVLIEYFKKMLMDKFNADLELKRIVKGYEADQIAIQKKYKWAFKSLSQKSQWPLTFIFGVELFLNEEKTNSVLIAVNNADLRTFTIAPMQMMFLIKIPKALIRPLDMSYKCQWTSPVFDDESQKMLAFLNFENSSIEQRLKSMFSQDYLYNFKLEELIDEKGKKTKIKHDQTLLSPINVLPIEDPLADEQEYAFALKYFLKIGRTGEYEGILPIYNSIIMMSDLFKVLRRYIVATPEEIEGKRQQEEQKQQQQKQEQSDTLSRCIKCGWLLSKTSIKCPMCGSEVSSTTDKKSMGVESSFYSASSALHGAKENMFSNKLIDQFDKAIEEWGDAESKRANIVLSNFKEALGSGDARNSITQVLKNEDKIKEIIGPVFRGNRIAWNREVNTFARFLVELKGFELPWIYVVFDRLKMTKEEIYPVVVSYIVTADYSSHKYSYVKHYDSKKKELIWEIDAGKDPPVVTTLNFKSEEFISILKSAYNDASTNEFIEPLIDSKGKVKGVDISIQLYPLIRVEPLLDDKSNPKTIIIMRQFLDNEIGGLKGFIPLSKVFAIMETLSGIISIYKEDYSKKADDSDLEKEANITVDFSEIDRKLEESKYPSKKSASIQQAPPAEIGKPQGQVKTSSSLDDELMSSSSDMKVDDLLGSTTSISSIEDVRSKTFFSKQLPGDFVIDSSITDSEINSLLIQLNSEIITLRSLIENEFSSYRSGNQSLEMCQNQTNVLLNQIREKQAKFRAYEFEKFRIKPERYAMNR